MQIIDGSVLEGGGQILRIAISLSALLRKSVKVINIRKGRKKPGLASQHLKGIELVKQISNAQAHGLQLGSTEVEFHPNELKGGEFTADAITAGSITLLLQIALPVSLFCDHNVTLNLKGGTNAEMAPQYDFTIDIFRKNLERFGATFDVELIRRGFYPRGGGNCIFRIQPIQQLQPIEVTDFGIIDRIDGLCFVSGRLNISTAERMKSAAEKVIRSKLGSNVSINIRAIKEDARIASDSASGIILNCQTTTNCILGGSALGSVKEQPFQTGIKATSNLLQSIEKRSCVDQYVQDQLIIFMALANGTSRIVCDSPITEHTKTAIYVIELLTQAKFNLIEQQATTTIICTGIGLKNIHNITNNN